MVSDALSAFVAIVIFCHSKTTTFVFLKIALNFARTIIVVMIVVMAIADAVSVVNMMSGAPSVAIVMAAVCAKCSTNDEGGGDFAAVIVVAVV